MFAAIPAIAVSLPPDSDSQSQTTSLVPKTQKKKENILNKFFITMLWVTGSCGLIYGALYFYRKIKNPLSEAGFTEKDIALDLHSPDTIEESVDFVIKKF